MATAVTIKPKEHFKTVATYDATNGNTVTNTLDVAVYVALVNGETVVDGTKTLVKSGGSVDYASGLTATDIVIFLPKTDSLLDSEDVYAE
jgi:hypothetical protein